MSDVVQRAITDAITFYANIRSNGNLTQVFSGAFGGFVNRMEWFMARFDTEQYMPSNNFATAVTTSSSDLPPTRSMSFLHNELFYYVP